MKAWRVLIAISFLLLSGCLVTFTQAIPPRDSAPAQLFGVWSTQSASGETLELEISQVSTYHYNALSYRKGDREHHDSHAFTVSRHGSRWYLSAGLPARYGDHYLMAGFELADSGELVFYNLDMDRFSQWVEHRQLAGQRLPIGKGEGLLISSPLDEVFRYLDDPANSDVFLEVARYQRLPK
jgi:hypothetical protein